MQAWYVGGEVALLLVLLLVLSLVLFALRRRWLSRQGGTFECSLRLSSTTPGSGWALGVARYNDEELEWFRFFSYSTRPRQAFRRHDMAVVNDREPDPVEAGSLYVGQRIVQLRCTSDPEGKTWELAMSGESLTGMLSWLEAAPPGVTGY